MVRLLGIPAGTLALAAVRCSPAGSAACSRSRSIPISPETIFHVDYTALNGNTVIAEYRAGAARPTETRVLANFTDPASNHNGGRGRTR